MKSNIASSYFCTFIINYVDLMKLVKMNVKGNKDTNGMRRLHDTFNTAVKGLDVLSCFGECFRTKRN